MIASPVTRSRYVLTAHVVVDGGHPKDLLKSLSQSLRDEFDIFHTTIQLEDAACGDLHETLHEGAARRHGDEDHGPGDHAGHAH